MSDNHVGRHQQSAEFFAFRKSQAQTADTDRHCVSEHLTKLFFIWWNSMVMVSATTIWFINKEIFHFNSPQFWPPVATRRLASSIDSTSTRTTRTLLFMTTSQRQRRWTRTASSTMTSFGIELKLFSRVHWCITRGKSSIMVKAIKHLWYF